MDPISYFQAIVLGLLQGVSELFPISSLGHSVVLPRVFGWNIHQNDDYFLSFLVATHCATAIVLFFFFLKDWVRILKGLGRSLRDRYIDPDDTVREARLAARRSARFPAGLLGLLLEHPLRSLFASTETAAIFLFVNGLMLFGAEALRRRAPVRSEQGIALRRGDRAHADLPLRARNRRSAGPRADPGPFALRREHGRRAASPGSPTRRRPASPSCSPRRSSAPPACSSCPSCLDTRATTSADRHSWVRSPRRSRPTSRSSFLLRFFETNRLTPFAVYCCAVGAVLSIAFALS